MEKTIPTISACFKLSDERHISTLLYCLGAEDAEDVLASTNISEEDPREDRKKYDQVLEKFDTHFLVRRNIIFERARFNGRYQQEGESAEQLSLFCTSWRSDVTTKT